jgi:hypothetical protein
MPALLGVLSGKSVAGESVARIAVTGEYGSGIDVAGESLR